MTNFFSIFVTETAKVWFVAVRFMAEEMRRLLLHNRKNESMFLKISLYCVMLSRMYTWVFFCYQLQKEKKPFKDE